MSRRIRTTADMKDTQNSPDFRNMPIRKVGIKGLRYPIIVKDRQYESQHTVARVNMYVDLPHHFKGTHMSRFVEILNQYHGRISIHKLEGILRAMIRTLDSRTAHLEIRFPYFIEKQAPVSGAVSLMDYDCAFIASLDTNGDEHPPELVVEVDVPVCTLCPCSKAISEDGAHNQRSSIRIQIRSQAMVWIEDLIEIAESEASAPLYSLLKREDEKAVTEQAYQNPRFVEDVVRGVGVRLKEDTRIDWYRVESENAESIHNHSAYALVEPENNR